MRWVKKCKKGKLPPRHDDQRVVRKFLFSPLTIQGETRWLEVVNIGQQYHRGNYTGSWMEWTNPWWMDKRWVSDGEYLPTIHNSTI